MSVASTMGPRFLGFVPVAPAFRLVATVLGFGYLLSVAAMAYWFGTPSLQILASLTLLVVLTLLPLLRGRADWGWFHPIVFCPLLVFVGHHLPLTGVFVLGMPHHVALPTWSFVDLQGLIAKDLLLSALGLASYYAGHLSGLSPPRPAFRFRRPRHLAALLFFVAVASSAIFFGFLILTRGGVVGQLQAWQELGRRDAIEGFGALIKITRFGSLAVLMWLAYDRRAWLSPLFWSAAALSLAVNFLGTGSRSSVLVLLIAALAVVSMQAGSLRFRTAVLVALGSVLLLGLLGAIRSSSSGRGIQEAERSPVEWIQASVEEMAIRESAVSSAYPIFALVPRDIGMLWGSTYLGSAAGFIPRALWPDKPPTIGRIAGEMFFRRAAGRPPGAVAEAYWNLHIPGIIVVFFLFGVFHRWLALWVRESPEAPVMLVVLALSLMIPAPTGKGLLEWSYFIVSVGILSWGLGILRGKESR